MTADPAVPHSQIPPLDLSGANDTQSDGDFIPDRLDNDPYVDNIHNPDNDRHVGGYDNDPYHYNE